MRYEHSSAAVLWAEALRRTYLLTERELDVFGALGRGMSNAQIAAHLCISERTVKHHVAEIRAKLRLESRLQIGIVASIKLLGGHPVG